MADSMLSHIFATWLGTFDSGSQTLYLKVSRIFANNINVIINLQALGQRHDLILHPHNCCEVSAILHPFSRQFPGGPDNHKAQNFYKVSFNLDLKIFKVLLTYDKYLECYQPSSQTY